MRPTVAVTEGFDGGDRKFLTSIFTTARNLQWAQGRVFEGLCDGLASRAGLHRA